MNLEELKKLKEKAQRQVALRDGNKKYRVVFSMGTSGIVAVTGEIGLVDAEPMIRIEEANGEKVTYARVNAADARKIVTEHLEKGKVVEGLAVGKVKE